MTNPDVVTAFLVAEIEALELFDFIAVAPAGSPLHVAEVTRREDGELEVRVPGRPPMLPALEVAVRTALRERDFTCEDAADPTKPWVHAVADAEAAVDLLRRVRVEIFDEKSDARLDIAHASHKAQHQAEKKLDFARTRIEPILADVLGKRAEQDDEGDYILPIDEVRVMVAPRATPEGHVVIRIFAITNVGFQVVPELGLFLARLNFGMMFGRFALDTEHRSIWFDESLLGEQFREEELRFAIKTVSTTADSWDDRLKQMFGGVTYQEVLAGRAAEALPPIKPGEGGGMYL